MEEAQKISTWYQDHTSKIINTKSKSIRPNRIRFNFHVRPYRVLRCGQLEVSRTCRFDVGTSIFLFDNSTPNLTGTSSAGASVQLITYDYCPLGPLNRQDLTTKKYNMLRDDLTWGKLHTEEKSNKKVKTPMVVSTMDVKELYLNVCQALKANASNTKKKHDNLVNTEAIMALVEIVNRKFERECINLNSLSAMDGRDHPL
jgi:hypothetical protein